MHDVASSLAERGETLVCNHLKDRGFSILAKNFMTRRGEIDIIARKEELVCFVEVKTRRSLRRGTGAEAVTPLKMKKILHAAKIFITKKRIKGCRYRIDVAEVFWPEGRKPSIKYYPNVYHE
jgi:putative endonuclease